MPQLGGEGQGEKHRAKERLSENNREKRERKTCDMFFSCSLDGRERETGAVRIRTREISMNAPCESRGTAPFVSSFFHFINFPGRYKMGM